MNVSSSGTKPKAVAMNVRERTRGWLNAINLHWAGVALLAAVNIYLMVQMGLAWKAANSDNAEALAAQRMQLTSAEIAAKPLQGLDAKLARASEEADQFYRERLPVSYSEILTELGVLKKKTGARLTRVQYSQNAVGGEAGAAKSAVPKLAGTGELTEVRMDASLTGDYRPLVLFMNELERDKIFFAITGVTLTGQQTGTVSLRVKLTTYLRGLVAEDEMPKVQVEDPAEASPVDLAKPAKGGVR